MDFFINSAYAQASGSSAGQGAISFAVPLVLLAVFYFLLIRPQNKRAKEAREMIAKVSTGDEVARIPVGGQKPMKMYRHAICLCLLATATNRLATTVITTRPPARARSSGSPRPPDGPEKAAEQSENFSWSGGEYIESIL